MAVFGAHAFLNNLKKQVAKMNEFTLDVTDVASPSDYVESLPENPPEPNTQFYSKSFPGNDIGAKARWAYRKYGLFRSARYPPYKPVFKSPLKEIFVVSVAFYRFSRVRLGGGLTYHMSPKVSGSGAASNIDTKFDNALKQVATARSGLAGPSQGARSPRGTTPQASWGRHHCVRAQRWAVHT